MAGTAGSGYILEEAQEVGDGFSLAVGQHGVVDAVSRAAWQMHALVAGTGRRPPTRLTAAARCEQVGEAHGGHVGASRPRCRAWAAAGARGSCRAVHGGATIVDRGRSAVGGDRMASVAKTMGLSVDVPQALLRVVAPVRCLGASSSESHERTRVSDIPCRLS